MIELEPFGLTAGLGAGRPIMLFREKGGEETLPVWLSPLDAGVALGLRSHAGVDSPHDVSLEVLKALNVRVESCSFNEVRDGRQFAELRFSGSRRLKRLTVRADHAVSFCLRARAKFYCTREYIARCRESTPEATPVEVRVKRPRPRVGARYVH